jgi:hypothetical protein
MANYGHTGPANAFAAAPVAAPTPERRQRQRLDELGFYLSPDTPNSRAVEKAATDREFIEAAGTAMKLGEATFVEHARRLWGYEPNLARAAFWACDVDGSGFMNKDEYLLFHAAMLSFDPARDNTSPSLLELRCRTIYALYAASRDDGLTAAERHALATDLCAGRSHVAAVQAAMGWPADDAQGRVQYAAFVGALQTGTLAQMQLHTRDLLRAQPARPPRLVLDPRCVQAVQPAAGGAAAAPQPTPVASAVPGGHMANHALVLAPSLRTPAGAARVLRGASSVSHGRARARVARRR